MKRDSQRKTFNPPVQRWIIPLTIFLSTLLFGGIFVITTFCPKIFFDSNPKYFNLCDYIQTRFIYSGVKKLIILGYFYWIIHSITTFFNIFFGFSFIREWLLLVSYKPWIKKYMDESAKIITSCDTKLFNDRVALLVATCNDLTENTILQICKQTYKNVDCWIIDDTTKQPEIERVNKFLRENQQIKYFRRSDQNRKEHPSQMGNIMAWVAAHGDEYDYICEVNTSSLLTDTFIENALCYFHSDILKDKKIGGIIALGCFFYSNTLLSWMNSQSRQFTYCTLNNSTARGAAGHEIQIRGWGSVYSLQAIKSIDWKKAECSCCATGRGREILRNGFDIMLNPFDFAGKVGIRDIDGYRKQNIKWNEGVIHLLRNKVSWGPCVKSKPFYMKWVAFFNAWQPIFLMTTFVMNIISSTYGLIAKVSFPNFAATFFVGCLWGVVWTVFILLALIRRVPISLMVGQFLSPLFTTSIYYFKLYDTIFTSFIFKKWSSKNVTKKTNKQYSFRKKIKLCWKDSLWILCFVTLCLFLQFGIHLPAYAVWYRFFVTIIWPSIWFIFWVFVGEIKIKKGWNLDQVEWKDFYKVFKINYNEVKHHPLWQSQHPEDK